MQKVLLDLEHGTYEVHILEERYPELPSPRIADYGKGRLTHLRSYRAGGRQPQHFAFAAKRKSLHECNRGAYPGETPGACPHYYALNAIKVELLDPVSVPAFAGGPLNIKCLHFLFQQTFNCGYA